METPSGPVQGETLSAMVIPMPTRADIEGAEPGISFRFEGIGNEDEAKRIIEAATPLFLELVGIPTDDVATEGEAGDADEPDGLFLGHLRLIVFTSDLRTAVFHWQRELGLPEALTENDEGVAVGKNLVWGDGKVGSTFAVVLFNLNIVGYGLLDAKPLAHCLFAHELAHAHLGPVLREVLGPTMNDRVRASDWPSVRAHLAINCFDEFYAEYIASKYADDEVVELSTDLLVTVASGVRARVRERVATYRHAGSHNELWDFTITEVSSFTNQLGRVLGLFYDQQLPAELVVKLDALSPRFAEHLREMQAAWNGIMSLSYDALTLEAFARGEAVVEQVFTTFGVIPKWDGDSFAFEVPWWPGEHERATAEHYAAARERARQVQAQLDEFTTTMAAAMAAFRR